MTSAHESPLFTSRPEMRRQKVMVLAGPTASGKSDLAIQLAKQIGAEIISCDSVQVYRGMDIGTAKVCIKERSAVPHHLIDVRDLQDPMNVVEFHEEAMAAIRLIQARKKNIILCGGTGFYIRSVLYGPPQTPSRDPSIREKVEKDFENYGPEMMYDKLRSFDPIYASSITCNDRHKLIRAIEIIEKTGRPVSDIPVQSPEDMPWNLKFHCWFIHYPKQILYERINARCEEMLDAGLLEEVRELIPMGLAENFSASQAIGYRQCLEFLATQQTQEDFEKLKRDFQMYSRHYAKRQLTWFRKEPLFTWLDLSQISRDAALGEMIRDFEADQ